MTRVQYYYVAEYEVQPRAGQLVDKADLDDPCHPVKTFQIQQGQAEANWSYPDKCWIFHYPCVVFCEGN